MKSVAQFSMFVLPAVLSFVFASPSNAQQEPAKNYQLKGVWAGVAYLDEEKLKAKVDAIQNADEKKALMAKAQLFLSAVAAYEFKETGEYESDFEIDTDDGEIARAATIGKFKVVEADGPKMIVQFLEKTKEPDAAHEKKLIQFYEDGEHMAVVVPAPAELADCNPLLVFERVSAEQLAAPSEIAKEPSNSTIK